jgi:hypothetical protein
MKKTLALLLVVLFLSSCELITDNWANTNTPHSWYDHAVSVETGSIVSPLSPSVPTSSPMILFTSTLFHFSLRHPGCDIQEDTFGVVLICGSDQISIVRQKDRTPFPLPPVSPEVLVLASGTANLYHDVDQKTGAKRDIVVLPVAQTKEILIMSGYGPVFDQIIQTIHISP